MRDSATANHNAVNALILMTIKMDAKFLRFFFGFLFGVLITIYTAHLETRPIRHDSYFSDSLASGLAASGDAQIKNGVGRVTTDQNNWLEKPDCWMVY